MWGWPGGACWKRGMDVEEARDIWMGNSVVTREQVERLGTD